MGGGAVMLMRKVVGLGVIGSYNKGISSSSVSLADRVVTARNTAIPFNPSIYTTDLKHSTISSQHDHTPFCCQINDDDEEHQQQNIMDSIPRFVFGTVPNLQEAKAATSDLKYALDKGDFSIDASVGACSSTNVQGSTLTKSVSAEDEMLPSDSQHAFRAFSLLRDNPEVQNVVSSLVSDKSVWEAVMKNEEVMEFYKNMSKNTNMSTSESWDERIPKNESEGSSVNGYTSFVQAIKFRTSEMVRKITEFLQYILNPAESGSSGYTFLKSISRGAPFMILTIATVMVVMVKRSYSFMSV